MYSKEVVRVALVAALGIALSPLDTGSGPEKATQRGHDRMTETSDEGKSNKAGVSFESVLVSTLHTVELRGFIRGALCIHGRGLNIVLLTSFTHLHTQLEKRESCADNVEERYKTVELRDSEDAGALHRCGQELLKVCESIGLSDHESRDRQTALHEECCSHLEMLP